jgi:hypothetical protein
MRFLPFLVLFAFLCSCRNNSDLLQQRFDKADLQADLNACRKILETAHPSLYDYRSIKEMDALFDSLSAKLTDNSSLQEFYQQLSVISSRIGCYHTGFMLPTAFEDSIRKRKAFFPFPILVEEGKVYNNYNDLMIPFGCELTAINGHKMDSILKILKKYSAADGYNETYPVNHLELEFARNYFLQFGPSATFDISYKDTSSSPSEYQLNLPAVDYNTILNRNEYPYYHGIAGVDFDFYLDEQEIYGVLVLNSFYPEGLSGNDAFRHFLDNSFRTLADRGIQHLVIDLRNNGGGAYSNAFDVYAQIAMDTFRYYKSAYTSIDHIPFKENYMDEDDQAVATQIEASLATEFAKGKNRFWLLKSENELQYPSDWYPFAGKVYVLTSAETVSAGSYLAAMIKDSKRGIIVGEETGGGANMHNGFSSLYYTLPNTKIKLYFSFAHVRHNMKTPQPFGRGVIPDHEVPTRKKDFLENTDSQLNYIIDSLLN